MLDLDLVIGVSFILLFTIIIVGGVLLFPLSRKLGLLIEARLEDRRAVDGNDAEQIEQISARLAGLEDQVRALTARQQFLDELLVERPQEDPPRRLEARQE